MLEAPRTIEACLLEATSGGPRGAYSQSPCRSRSTMCLLVTAARPQDHPVAVEAKGADVEQGSASEVVPSFRPNDPLAIEAYFPKESYRPGTTARLRFETPACGSAAVLPPRAPNVRPWETWTCVGRRHAPVRLGPIRAGGSTRVTIGNWSTGLYFAQLTASGGRVGMRRSLSRRGASASRVAVVLPTRTWQAYNFRDDDGDGLGDTWYATRRHDGATPPAHSESWRPSPLPQLRPALPPLAEPEWQAGSTSSRRRSSRRRRHALRRAYDVLVFPGHHEYVTKPSTTTSKDSATSAATSSSSRPTTSSGGSTSSTAS